jgi:sulfate transport system ATP-binding protein
MSIIIDQISKRYGNQWVVDNVSLEIANRELFVLLGSSGSGKSTILRIIAGLAEPSAGRVMLHGKEVTHLIPQERGTGFVFQNYSIFRHMSVAENIEFGLKIRKASKKERHRKRDELLELVGLAGLGSRYAHQLSGGQQQRVALARALAYEPNVLLLDEPFGALDVKIRAQLRRSLKEIQQRLGVTTILVTHDQEEAFELGDRIGVLERGRLLEVGPGESLYRKPRSLFAATFLGTGTVLIGRVEEGRARFGPLILPIPKDVPHDEGARVQLLFRPEQVAVSSEAPPPDIPLIGKGSIAEQSFAGPLRRLRVKMPPVQGLRQIAPPLPFGEEGLMVDATLPSESTLNGEDLWVGLRAWTILKPPAPRLLVCDEGADSTSPLVIARLMKERLGADITLLGVAERYEAIEQLKVALSQRQHQSGLDAEMRVRHGKPSEQIGAEQAESFCDMIVLAPRTGPKPARLPALDSRARSKRLGNTLTFVLEQADVPVLVVKGERPNIGRVLICTAAGEPGKSDVLVGGRLARQLGASATLLYIVSHSQEPDALAHSHLARASATLRNLGIAADVRIRPALKIAGGIIEESREGEYDLIVVGKHGPRSRSLFSLNDVTLEVLTEADRPVLVVPTDRL